MNEPRLEELAQNYLVRDNYLYKCTICGKSAKDKYAAKMHLESKHFPTIDGYACEICRKLFNTKNAYNTHKTNLHKHYWQLFLYIVYFNKAGFI